MSKKYLTAIFAWVIAAIGSTLGLYCYVFDISDKGQPVASWPSDAEFDHDPTKWTLVVFSHPRCPCTRATLGQLAHLQTRFREQIELVLVQFHPAHESRDWTLGPSQKIADRIPDLKTVFDPGGQVCDQFGVRTSGHSLLYTPNGQLAFSGGLTNGRGHAGSSTGIDTISQLVRTGESARSTTPVFGCPILPASDMCDRQECEEHEP